MPTPEPYPQTFTEAEFKALQQFARRIMQYNYTYTKTVIMEKINKQVNGDSDRAKRALYCLIKAGIVRNEPGGKISMPNH